MFADCRSARSIPSHRCQGCPQAGGGRCRASQGRRQESGAAGPGQAWADPRHRPGAAPAAALRGRNPYRADCQRARRQRGADRGHGYRLRGAVAPAPPAGGAGGGCQRQLRAALLQLLPLAPEDAGGGQQLAHPGRDQGRLLGQADGAPGVSPGGRRAAAVAHAGLPHGGRAAAALFAARGRGRPHAGRAVGDAAAGRAAALYALLGPECITGLV